VADEALKREKALVLEVSELKVALARMAEDDHLKVPPETVAAAVDFLRLAASHQAEDLHSLADALQFDDGRCRVCGHLAGGDRKHRCWVSGEHA